MSRVLQTGIGMKLAALLLTGLFTVAAHAADISGTWSGMFKIALPDGSTGKHGAYLVLKQSGEKITGTAGQMANVQHPITSGKIEGDHVVLSVAVPDQGDFTYDLNLEGDHLKGNVEANVHSHDLKATVDLTRVKKTAAPANGTAKKSTGPSKPANPSH